MDTRLSGFFVFWTARLFFLTTVIGCGNLGKINKEDMMDELTARAAGWLVLALAILVLGRHMATAMCVFMALVTLGGRSEK